MLLTLLFNKDILNELCKKYDATDNDYLVLTKVVKKTATPTNVLPIYTEEELEELRRQEIEDEEESYGVDIDDDYDEYDDDDYYED